MCWDSADYGVRPFDYVSLSDFVFYAVMIPDFVAISFLLISGCIWFLIFSCFSFDCCLQH